MHRVHRGVYAVGHLALTRNGRFMAAVLACGEGAALSHLSAAVLWGILEDRGQRDPCDGGEAGGGAAASSCTESPLEGDRVRRRGHRRDHRRPDARRPRRCRTQAAHARAGLRRGGVPAASTGRAPRPIHGRSGSGLLASVLAVHEPGTTRTLLRARGALPGVLREPRPPAARGERQHRGIPLRLRVAGAARDRRDRRAQRAHGTTRARDAGTRSRTPTSR